MDPSFVMTPKKRKYEWDSEEPKARQKRRASASSRGPPPPLKIEPDEIVFRILCVGSKTGAIIGKGGSIIKQIRKETGAKIRIDEGVLGCEQRVIVIVAPQKDIKGDNEKPVGSDDNGQTEKNADETSAAKEQGKGAGSEEDLEKEKRISPAQEALLRVHDRILEGEPDVKVKEETDKKTTPTVIRLLVPINQVGCVLGKGGKIIQQIRIESGSQVRVLSREQVPACALPTDEVVQIMGDVTSVKKALLAVSDRLRENPPRDRENVHTSRPVGHLSQGSGIPHGDIYSRNNSSVMQGARFPGGGSFGVIDYHSKGPSSVYMMHETGPNMRQIVHPQEEITFRLLCSNDKVGGIIGKAGSIVKGLQRDTGAEIKIANSVPEEDERVVIITASAVAESRLSPAQNALLRVCNRVVTSGPEKDKFAKVRLLVPSNQIGCLLGKGGIIIAEMRKLTGSNICIFGKDQLPKCASQNDQVVEVTGEQGAVQEALVRISTRLQNNLFPEKPVSVAGVGIYPEHMPPVPGPLAPFRGRAEPGSPPGMYPHYGEPIQDIDQGARLPHNVDRTGFPGNVHRPGGMHHDIDQPPSAGPWAVQGGGMHHNIDQPPSAGPWAVQGGGMHHNIDQPPSAGPWAVQGGGMHHNIDQPQSTGPWAVQGGGMHHNIDQRPSTGPWAHRPGGMHHNIDQPPPAGPWAVQGGGMHHNIDQPPSTGPWAHRPGGMHHNIDQPPSAGPWAMQGGGMHHNIDQPPSAGPWAVQGGGMHHDIDQPPSAGPWAVQGGGMHHNIDQPPSAGPWAVQGGGMHHNIDQPPSTGPWAHRPGGMHHNIDQPPSAGPWAVQGMGDGRGYPQRGSLGSGSQSAVVTNTTVEVVVPERVIGSIYGENGSNLAHIQQISGAKVIMNEPRPGASEGLVIISGTPEQTHAAQSLVQAFIMSGQSSQ